MSNRTPPYAGDVSAVDAWATLGSDPKAALVDVRTTAEWTFVGVPDLSAAGKETILQEWQVYPTMQVNAGFVDKVAEALAAAGVTPDSPVFFLCRSGARSKAAATALAAKGWTRCFNVAGGFEGPVSATGHRGESAGWKADGLPWAQS